MTPQEYDQYLAKMERRLDLSLAAMVLAGFISALAAILSSGFIP